MTKIMYPTNDLYKSYDGYEFNTTFSREISDVTLRITLEHMNYAINLCEEWGTCLDIGGGDGRYLTALSTRFKKNFLVEVREEEAHKSITKKYTNITIHKQLIEDYPTNTKADFILLADLYEHIRDISSFVEKISNLQNTGSVVYIMTPNPLVCGPAPESGLYHTRHKYGHIKHYPKQEICHLMQKNGYELMFTRYEEGHFRQKAKGIIFALSRRDKKFQKSFLYQIIRPFVLFAVKPLKYILDTYTYTEEKRQSQNEFFGLTQDMAFKKVL